MNQSINQSIPILKNACPPPHPSLPPSLLQFSAEGDAESAPTNSQDAKIFRDAVAGLSSAEWWSARACVTHARLLLSTSVRSDTLWTEALDLFGRAVGLFGGGVVVAAGAQGEAVRMRVAGQVWLEWGLAQHHFQVSFLCLLFACCVQSTSPPPPIPQCFQLAILMSQLTEGWV